MMRRTIAAALAGLAAVAAAAAAGPDLEAALQEDVVLRALVDELGRSFEGLELEGLARPYFIEYALLDGDYAGVSASFGAVTSRSARRARSLRADVRVGSYELDNTNFRAGYGGRGGFGGADVPIEDDYNAIRQAVWWLTDRDYKNAAEALVQKQAFMESKMIVDKPSDFSREEPVVYLEERLRPALDPAALEELAVTLSRLFRAYPDLKDATVNISAGGGTKYLVNTEGTRLRWGGELYSVSVSAEVQADDGMELSDELEVFARRAADLPAAGELAARCREMVERLIAVKNAPRFDEAYTGPVLFEAEPAAEIFAQQFAGRFAGGQRPVGSRTSPDDFANMLNRRVLPRFLHVVDDPTRRTVAGVPALGHYLYDDQGVAARPVTLVEGGRLRALLMSRNPSKEFARSTGHGRGLMYPTAGVGCLTVTADPAATPDELRQELLEAIQDEGLEYGIRIAALGGSAATPLVVYKVYPDGREELVRGVEIARFDLKAFKRLLAAGDSPHVLNSGGRSEGRTLAAPAMLFEELDLAKIDRDFDKPPILPSPLARP